MLQGALIRQQVMQLAPEVAASLGVPAQQVTSAMAAALAAARDEAVGQGLGMALELRHDCRLGSVPHMLALQNCQTWLTLVCKGCK